jgi:hypothetical protein
VCSESEEEERRNEQGRRVGGSEEKERAEEKMDKEMQTDVNMRTEHDRNEETATKTEVVTRAKEATQTANGATCGPCVSVWGQENERPLEDEENGKRGLGRAAVVSSMAGQGIPGDQEALSLRTWWDRELQGSAKAGGSKTWARVWQQVRVKDVDSW